MNGPEKAPSPEGAFLASVKVLDGPAAGKYLYGMAPTTEENLTMSKNFVSHVSAFETDVAPGLVAKVAAAAIGPLALGVEIVLQDEVPGRIGLVIFHTNENLNEAIRTAKVADFAIRPLTGSTGTNTTTRPV